MNTEVEPTRRELKEAHEDFIQRERLGSLSRQVAQLGGWTLRKERPKKRYKNIITGF